MPIKKIMDKIRSDDEDNYLELELPEEPEKPTKKIMIQVEKIENFSDAERVQKKVREGYVQLVRIRTLKDKDMVELKRAIEKIKKTCLATSGEITGLGDDWLILTPQGVTVFREIDK